MVRGFPEAMRGQRKAMGMTITELAKATSISESALRYYERGERSPSMLRFLRICSALKIDYKVFEKNF